MWIPLPLLLACADPVPEGGVVLRAAIVHDDGEVTWADVPAGALQVAADAAGSLWSTDGATVAENGAAVATAEDGARFTDLAAVDGRVVAVEERPEGSLAVHFAAEATVEEVPDLRAARGPVVAGAGAHLWVVAHSRGANATGAGPIQVHHRGPEGWDFELLGHLLASRPPLEAAATSEGGLAFSWHRGDRYRLRAWGDQGWTDRGVADAPEVTGLALGGDGALWAALVVQAAGGLEPSLLRVGECEVALDELRPPIAIRPTSAGVRAYGFDADGVLWVAQAESGCAVYLEPVEAAATPLLRGLHGESGTPAVVVGEFAAD